MIPESIELVAASIEEATAHWLRPPTQAEALSYAHIAVSAAAPFIEAEVLREARTVEWGVEREGEVIGYFDERHARLSAAASVLHGNSALIVSRNIGPWERAE